MRLRLFTSNSKTILRAAAFCAALLLALTALTNVLQKKDSDFKLKPFFDQKADFDVLFFGASHMLNGVFPMELWNDYGIVSYNFGGHATKIPTSYWVMQNALDYTAPRLVVLDVLDAGNDSKISDNSDFLHLSLDAFPITAGKIRAVRDLIDSPGLVDENGIDVYRHRWEFVWDLGKYHNRWSELTVNDFTNAAVTREKGAESRINVAVPNQYERLPASETLDSTDHTGFVYLRRMIEACQSRGIDILLVNLPYPCPLSRQREANSVYAIAEEYGVEYLNFAAMDGVVNYRVDCYDARSHLNPSGARKVTDYLGRYITDRYGIPDRRGDGDYAGWFRDYEDYVNLKTENIQAQTTLENTLMLLADDDFQTEVWIRQGAAIPADSVFWELVENMGAIPVYTDRGDAPDAAVKVPQARTGTVVAERGWQFDGEKFCPAF